ncbi:glutamine--fructose-6-phosphate transaminase (isomerizing) [Burkholderiales bacterium]|nr:glutamine--fructose-6-phosphate transaminase (isomerizing) [Burkholderiales bacterium]
MCGIVAAVSNKNIVPFLIDGLLKLEYRGYDSAGLAVINGKLHRVRNSGRVRELATKVQSLDMKSSLGIAHTRWATHGAPSEKNAHPHISRDGLALVHNGIIENHESLRQSLIARGYMFTSDTDSEVIAHLIHKHTQSTPDLLTAVRYTVDELVGAFALAVINEQSKNQIILARRGAPLLVGLGDEEVYCASDSSALLKCTKRMIFLEDGDLAHLTASGATFFDASGEEVTRNIYESNLSSNQVDLGGFDHYMQKEIFEQPGALAATLEMVTGSSAISPELFGTEAASLLKSIDSVTIIACGTSFHSGLTAKYWLEEVTQLPVFVEIASEYRYRKPIPNPNTLIVVISQSGETADTIAALEYAKNLGQTKTLSICNVPESSIIRSTKLKFLTRAGPEIGVASTKAFTTQLASLYLLTLVIAKLNGKISLALENKLLKGLRHLPAALNLVLKLESKIIGWAKRISTKNNALFLGRGIHYPIALEGALKLKEISYIHAEGYPAGELKHGPLALVDNDTPVVAVAPNDALLEKLKSNLSEVRARGGELYVFADADSNLEASEGLHIIKMTEHLGHLSPILHSIPLQLLAYHVALARGTDVDKPRNLAKSVTVE